MKNFYFKLLYLFCALIFTQAIYSHNFEVDGKFYSYVSNVYGNECRITYKGSSYQNADYSGILEIPEQVTFNGRTYKVTGIADYAFYNCSGLTYVTMPESITRIGQESFRNCTGLTQIDIPLNVSSWGNNPFAGCTNIKRIIWRPKATYDFKEKGSPFYSIRTNIEKLEVEEDVTHIPAYLCDGMTKLNYLNFPRQTEYHYLIEESLKSIGKYAFRSCSNLSSVALPEGVLKIDDNAFDGCTKLKYLYVPIKLTTIGAYSFYGCQELTNITVPERVTTVGNYAFANCPWITEATIGKSVTNIGTNIFDGCSALKSIIWNAENCTNFSDASKSPFYNIGKQITNFKIGLEVKSIPDYLCYGMSNLTTAICNGDVATIGKSSFENCTELKEVLIGDRVESIGSRAFYGCTWLSNVYLGKRLTSIGTYAFANCKKLSLIEIPDNITSIGTYAFDGCSGLKEIKWNVTSYNGFSYSSQNPFYGCRKSITQIQFGSNVTKIPAYLCYGMTGLTSVTIPDNITTIGTYAFNGCSGLKEIEWNVPSYNDFSSYSQNPFYDCRKNITRIQFGNNVTKIPAYMCYDMPSLIYVNIPDYITTIGQYTFYGCSNLSSIRIPDYVTKIGMCAFEGCTNLNAINIPNNVTSIGSLAFYGCSNVNSFFIPRTTTYIGEGAFAWCSESVTITLENGNTKYIIDDEILYNIDKTTIKFCPRRREGTFVIPNSVSAIEACTFAGCSKLSAIEIPATVNYMGSSVFTGCKKLIDVIIPDGITQIPLGAFRNCSSLSSVKIPNGVTSIGHEAFEGCSSLSKVSLPNSLTIIESEAFNGCTSLETLNIPQNSKKLCGSVFRNCTNLKNIYSYVTEPSNHSSGTTLDDEPYKNIILYVPMGTKELYQKVNYWKCFSNIIEFDASAIENISATKQDTTVTNIYSIDGTSKPTSRKGLEIRRMSDGNTIKVIK